MNIVRNRWIPVNERMPIEYDSIFAAHKGTDKWKNGMFEKNPKMYLLQLSAVTEAGEHTWQEPLMGNGKQIIFCLAAKR